eukprot:14057785-Alexandrium_andersonii.AAC.1
MVGEVDWVDVLLEDEAPCLFLGSEGVPNGPEIADADGQRNFRPRVGNLMPEVLGARSAQLTLYQAKGF